MTLGAVQPRTTQETWKIDPAHSSIEFAVKHMVVTTMKGHFSGFSGTIVMDEADPTRSSVQIEIDAATIDTRTADRDQHLRSADFLDVESYPKLTFTSRRIEGAGRDQFKLIGDLVIRGVSQEVVLDAELHGQGRDPWGGTRAGFSATTAIERKDYGLTWNANLETGGVLVGDQIKISVEVEAVRQ